MPSPASLRFDGKLTDFAVNYPNGEMIHDIVLPPKTVQQENYTYFEQDLNESLVLPNDVVAEDGFPNDIDVKFTKKTGLCVDHALSAFITNKDMEQADLPIDVERFKTEEAIKKVKANKELRAAAAVFNTNNYAAANQVDVAGTWATTSTDIPAALITGRNACWAPPTHFVADLPTFDAIARNTEVLKVVRGTLGPQDIWAGGMINPNVLQNELGRLLGVTVVIGKFKYATNKKGQTLATQYAWSGTNPGKGGAAFLRIGTESPWDLHTIRQFRYRTPVVLRSETGRGARGGIEVRYCDSYDFKSISTISGYLFKDTLVT